MKPISISNSELQVMKQLWEKSPQSAPELVSALQPETGWETNTIKTLLARLVEKGAVGQNGQRRSYLYSPLISCDEYREEASRNFLDSLFDSRPAALVNFFVNRGKLSAGEIAELKALLDREADHE